MLLSAEITIFNLSLNRIDVILLLLEFIFFFNFNFIFKTFSKLIFQCDKLPLLSPVINSFSFILITEVINESNNI